jgi:hypothetical protein
LEAFPSVLAACLRFAVEDVTHEFTLICGQTITAPKEIEGWLTPRHKRPRVATAAASDT